MEYRFLADDVVQRHWGHHQCYSMRHLGRRWRFEVVRVPVSLLHTWHDELGTWETPDGLMGSVGGAPAGYHRCQVGSLAQRLREGLESGQADLENPALRKLLFFRDLGAKRLSETIEEPMAFFQVSGQWFVMEGAHRTIALALAGEPEVEGLLFYSGQIAD